MKKLLFSVGIKDCRVDTFTVGGHGGAGKDTSNTGVRVVHGPSGASGVGTRSRSQLDNKRMAFVQMVSSPEFKVWHKRVCAELTSGKTIEERVEEDMTPDKLKVEVRGDDGKWRVSGPFETGPSD